VEDCPWRAKRQKQKFHPSDLHPGRLFEGLVGGERIEAEPRFSDLFRADVSHMSAQGNLKYDAFRGVRDDFQLSVVPLNN
jgi:hypothetical protein